MYWEYAGYNFVFDIHLKYDSQKYALEKNDPTNVFSDGQLTGRRLGGGGYGGPYSMYVYFVHY